MEVYDLTQKFEGFDHEILLQKARKLGKLWIEERGCTQLGLEKKFEWIIVCETSLVLSNRGKSISLCSG
jgi:hypothetical protein